MSPRANPAITCRTCRGLRTVQGLDGKVRHCPTCCYVADLGREGSKVRVRPEYAPENGRKDTDP